MNVEKNQITQSDDNMCKNCKAFYASDSFDGLCSGCFKKNHRDKKEELQIKETLPITEKTISVKSEVTTKEEDTIKEPIQKDRKRCFNCSKKVGLLGIECKCGLIYCNMHRLPEDHKCGYDFREEGKRKLEKEIIKVYNGKISQI